MATVGVRSVTPGEAVRVGEHEDLEDGLRVGDVEPPLDAGEVTHLGAQGSLDVGRVGLRANADVGE